MRSRVHLVDCATAGELWCRLLWAVAAACRQVGSLLLLFWVELLKHSTWGHSDDETAADDDAAADCEGKYVLSSSVFKKFQEVSRNHTRQETR